MSGTERNQHPRTDHQNPYNANHIVDKQADMTRQFPQYAPGWQHQASQDSYSHQLPPLTGAGPFVTSPQSQYPPAGPEYGYQYTRAPSYTSDMDVDTPSARTAMSYDSPSNRRRTYGHEPSSTPRGFQHTFPQLPPVHAHDSYPANPSQPWLSTPGAPQPQQQPQPQPQQAQQQQQQPPPPQGQPPSSQKVPLKHLPGSLMDQDPHWDTITQQPMNAQSSEPQHRSMVGQPGMPDPAPSRGAKQRFTPEDDELLRKLKEDHNLSWTQIADFFPDRRSGTLQVRYCTKIKKREENWSDDNISKLRSVVEDIRGEFWTQVAGRVGKGFTPQSCKDKWEELDIIDREADRIRAEQDVMPQHHSESVKREQQYHYQPTYRTS